MQKECRAKIDVFRLQQDGSKATWLPVEKIKHDATHTHVPVYAYPFAHEVYAKMLLARLRGDRTQLTVPATGWRNFVSWRDEGGRLHVCRPQDLPPSASSEDIDPVRDSKAIPQQGDHLLDFDLPLHQSLFSVYCKNGVHKRPHKVRVMKGAAAFACADLRISQL